MWSVRQIWAIPSCRFVCVQKWDKWRVYVSFSFCQEHHCEDSWDYLLTTVPHRWCFPSHHQGIWGCLWWGIHQNYVLGTCNHEHGQEDVKNCRQEEACRNKTRYCLTSACNKWWVLPTCHEVVQKQVGQLQWSNRWIPHLHARKLGWTKLPMGWRSSSPHLPDWQLPWGHRQGTESNFQWGDSLLCPWAVQGGGPKNQTSKDSIPFWTIAAPELKEYTMAFQWAQSHP